MTRKERFEEIDELVDVLNKEVYASEEYGFDSSPLWTLLACYTAKDVVNQPWTTAFKKKVAVMKRELKSVAKKMAITLEELLDWYHNYHLKSVRKRR